MVCALFASEGAKARITVGNDGKGWGDRSVGHVGDDEA